MNGRLRLEEEERRRLLLLCARVADVWARFSQDKDRRGGGTALQLVAKLRGHLVRLGDGQGVTLWGTENESQVVSWLLSGTVSRWLEGGEERAILDEVKSGELRVWWLTDYGRGLLDRAERLKLVEEGREYLVESCAVAAVAVSSCNEESAADELWDVLVRHWKNRGMWPPASSLTELLSWPLSWWLEGGPDVAFLEERDGEVRATLAALERADVEAGTEP